MIGAVPGLGITPYGVQIKPGAILKKSVVNPDKPSEFTTLFRGKKYTPSHQTIDSIALIFLVK
jgi:hypothetical protein